MKLAGIFLLILMAQDLMAQDLMAQDLNTRLIKRGQYQYPPSDSEIKFQTYQLKNQQKQNHYARLQLAKFYMLNGHFAQAKELLSESMDWDEKEHPTRLRYLATMAFLDENYQKSLAYLERPEFFGNQYQSEVCLLESLNYLMLKQNEKLKINWDNCLRYITHDSPTGNLWMRTMVDLMLKNPKIVTNELFDGLYAENLTGDYLRVYLKFALYLGREKAVLERIDKFNQNAFENDEIRELLGMLYYRDGQLVKAYSFLEDLDTPNAEAVKGNLYLAQNKFELAFAQYKLVLQKRAYSEEALGRIIPIAWQLRQWDEGLLYLGRLKTNEQNSQAHSLLKVANYIMKSDNIAAEKQLKLVEMKNRGGDSPLYHYLNVINQYALSQKNAAKESSEKSCAWLEGPYCWLLVPFSLWEEFPLALKAGGNILEQKKLISQLQNTETDFAPIDEIKIINQADIDELDGTQYQD